MIILSNKMDNNQIQVANELIHWCQKKEKGKNHFHWFDSLWFLVEKVM